MINGQYAQPGAFDNRNPRDRRDEYPPPPYTVTASSPPTSASPFAFAPPPLSSNPASRPSAINSAASTNMHSSEQQASQEYGYYARNGQAPPAPAPSGGAAATGTTYPVYSGSHPMGYRSVSGETTRAPPPAPLTRVPSFSMMNQAGVGSQPSPTATSPYYPPLRSSGPYASAQHSPRGANLYTQQPGIYSAPGYPSALEMPRSLSYPNSYGGAPYAHYLPSLSTPTLVHPQEGLPPLARHPSANSIGMAAPNGPGYAFASRLSLQERPFKCDICAQSFNRNHDLKRHKRIHLDVKPFGCEKCGKTFSRKDALRRHWMVRGCRGEEGATAPITPTFPPNGPPPTLSPPTPPNGGSSSKDKIGKDDNSNGYGSNPMSFSHPSAPPPLSTLPPRQSSDQPSQIILTPSEAHGRNGVDSDSAVIDPALSSLDSAALSSGRTSSTNETNEGSYFDPRNKDVPDSATSSTFGSRYANSPKDDMRHHPYRRSPLPSPSMHHPGAPHMGNDAKPMYLSYPGPNLLAPISTDDGNKDGSDDSSDPSSWNRWHHRPPFPPYPQQH